MTPNIFISWSGNRAREVAQAMHRFLPDVIQNARPWLSSEDIHKGRRWSGEVAGALKDARIGVVCLTPENLHADWMLFEGALARALDTAFVCPFLLGLVPADVGGPLGQFQLTTADRASTAKLITSINAALGGMVHDDRISRTFDRFWPDLQNVIDTLLSTPALDGGAGPGGEVLARLGSVSLEITSRLARIEEHIMGDVAGPDSSAAWMVVKANIRYYRARYSIASDEIRRLESLTPLDAEASRFRDESLQTYIAMRDGAEKELDAMLSGLSDIQLKMKNSST